MNTRRAGALALTLVLAAIPASAQDARVEAARREGKVVWYTSLALSSSERVAKLFEAAYPGIGVEVHRTGSQRILQRVMQELQANLRLVDVIHTSDAGHFVLLKAKKLLMKYTPAGVDAFPPGLKDRDGHSYGLRATVNVIAHNSKVVPAAQAPRTWKDLLDPKRKGKLVTAHPGYSGVIATHVLALVPGAPEPSAATLFTDFAFSREVQQVLADTEGLYTGHPDVPYPADKPKLGELRLLHTDPDELEKRTEEIRKRFVEFFGA